MPRLPICNPLLDVAGDYDPMNLVNPFAFGAGGFIPTDIAGCKLWLKADGSVYNTGTTQATDGQTVATWVDASGQGNDATQSTSGDRPTFKTNIVNSKPVVRFDGGTQYINWPSIAGRTFFTVFYANGSQPILGAFWGHDTNIEQLFWYFGETDNWATDDFTAADWLSGVWRKDGSIFTPTADNSISLNAWDVISVIPSSNRTTNQNRDRTQAGRVIKGDLAEFLIYDSALGSTDRANVESYLATKYGL